MEHCWVPWSIASGTMFFRERSKPSHDVLETIGAVILRVDPQTEGSYGYALEQRECEHTVYLRQITADSSGEFWSNNETPIDLPRCYAYAKTELITTVRTEFEGETRDVEVQPAGRNRLKRSVQSDRGLPAEGGVDGFPSTKDGHPKGVNRKFQGLQIARYSSQPPISSSACRSSAPT